MINLSPQPSESGLTKADNADMKYRLIEYEQVIDRLESFESMRLQIATLAGTANLTAIGFALTQQRSMIFLIAAGIIAFYLGIEIRARIQHQVYYYRGLQLQRLLSGNDPEAFLEIHTGAQSRKARQILSLNSPEARKEALKNSRTHLTGSFFWFPVLILFGEIILAIISAVVFSWPLF